MKQGPTYQRYNIPPDAPLSSQMLNDIFDGWLVGFAVIFNTPLQNMTDLREICGDIAKNLATFDKQDAMARGILGDIDQDDHTSNWRHV